MFPAHAGMNRLHGSGKVKYVDVPRTRGDEPNWPGWDGWPQICSPHAAACGALPQKLPHWCAGWLELLPSAILSALIAAILFFDTWTRTFLPGKPELIAVLPTFLFAIKTRSLAGTVVVGMLCYRLLALLSGQ